MDQFSTNGQEMGLGFVLGERVSQKIVCKGFVLMDLKRAVISLHKTVPDASTLYVLFLAEMLIRMKVLDRLFQTAPF